MESQKAPPVAANGATTEPKTIVVGMSGGVDSSVVAALLHEQGHRVIGLFMKNWDESGAGGECPATQDFNDVARVCERIGIPYYSVEFVQEYWDHVFKRFLEEYQAGYTPNPDILCNREIKFHFFLEKARALGADYLATGHYCRVQKNETSGADQLLKGLDAGKDQSYFVYTLTEKTLAQVLFPIGDLEKKEVRAIAEKYGLITAAKKDSTGICFIGERNFRPFLKNYVAGKPGEFRTLNGTPVGRHEGAAFYTLGQRKGLGLGGEGEPWFVVAKDPEKNIVYVERGSDHPALYAQELEATEWSWVADAFPSEAPFRAQAKVRYRQSDQPCTVFPIPADSNTPLLERKARVVFDEPQRAITPGQSVVIYDGAVCLGGGVIRKVGQTLFELGLRTSHTRTEPASSNLQNAL